MQIFLDTANAEQIARGVATGCVAGVTTNPTIIAREKKSLSRCVQDIVAVDPELVILLEAMATGVDEIVREARELSGLAGHVVVKLPMTAEGLSAARRLSQEGIRTTVTLVFSLNQAVAAACAGADFVAPFVGRLDDINADGLGLVRSIKQTFTTHQVKTQVIGASVRTPQMVADLFAVGCDVVTMPEGILAAMLRHPLTDAGLKKFSEDWKTVPHG